MKSCQKNVWFHERPLCIIAIGLLLGVLMIRIIATEQAVLAAALLLMVALSAAIFHKRRFLLLFCCMALGLLNAAFHLPADGTIPKSGPVVTVSQPRVSAGFCTVRDLVGERIRLLFPENGAVAKGMLLGEKDDIDAATMEQFGRVGVLHLLAVSGLHVSVLAGALALLFRRNPWVRFAAVAIFCAGYAALTAFSASVLRASLMLLYWYLAFPLRRRPDGPSALAFSFIVIVGVNPLTLFRTGFQLSFLAVYGLMLLEPLFARPLARFGSTAAGLIAGSCAVVVATAPAMALHFRELSFMSLLTNLFVLPMAPFFLVPAFLATVVSFLSLPIAEIISKPGRFARNFIVAV
ncbi:MAG: ComEC/Rec2 family competence protein [Clostridia bacterium]